MTKRWIWIGVLVCAAIAGYVAWKANNQTTPATPLADIISRYPEKDASDIDISHLSDELIPPTNKWFSGFALQKEPKPGFTYPLSVKPTNSTFEIGLPHVTTSSDVIVAPHIAGVKVTIKDADKYLITRYDDLSVDLTYYRNDTELATITVVQGSPFVFVNSHIDNAVSVDINKATERNNAWFDVRSKDKLTTIYAAQDKDDLKELERYSDIAISGGEATYRVGNDTVETILRYKTEGNKPTIIATLPHHAVKQQAAGVSYRSVLGNIKTIESNELRYTLPKVDTVKKLDLKSISADKRKIIKEQLVADADNIKLDSPDTYFGGKQLQRTATLLQLADQLQEKTVYNQLLDKLTLSFNNWLDPNSDYGFYYDSKLKTIAGKQAGFGANEANDHHFHYGHFIYAASVLATYDETFVDRHGDTIRLLVADIMNADNSKDIMRLRVFDSYAGHSWASGAVPFADGNNQESSSEAINAWVAVSLWAEATNDADLADTASWILANEVASADKYFLNGADGYNHKSVGIVWGGKRAWETWFSAEPNAIVGIQLLPPTPTMMQLYLSDKLKVGDVVNQPGLTTQEKFGDYILMARAVNQPINIGDAQKLPDEAIDDGNSRSYLYAWVASLSSKE